MDANASSKQLAMYIDSMRMKRSKLLELRDEAAATVVVRSCERVAHAVAKQLKRFCPRPSHPSFNSCIKTHTSFYATDQTKDAEK